LSDVGIRSKDGDIIGRLLAGIDRHMDFESFWELAADAVFNLDLYGLVWRLLEYLLAAD